MSKRGRQQGRQDQRYQGQTSGRRQSSNRMPYQSNDWSRNPSSEWNDGGLGGSQNYPGGSPQYPGFESHERPRHFSGDDTRFERRESYSGDWETDQGRASYGAGPGTSREYGQRFNQGGFGQESFGRQGGAYGRDYEQNRYGQPGQFGPRGGYGQGSVQGEYGQRGDYGHQPRTGHGDYGSGSYSQPGYESQSGWAQSRHAYGPSGEFNRGQQNPYGPYGNFERGPYGQDQYGRGQYGQGQYGRGQFGPGQFGQRGGQWSSDTEHQNWQGSGFEGSYGERSGWSSHTGRGPKGYQRSDERIREEVSDELTDDPHVDASEITVEVKDGEVTLSGSVQSREEKRVAEGCAEQVSGVREVINQLRVSRMGTFGESSIGGSGSTIGSGKPQGQTAQSQSGRSSRSNTES